jgi:large subunit ribosomal protein L31e
MSKDDKDLQAETEELKEGDTDLEEVEAEEAPKIETKAEEKPVEKQETAPKEKAEKEAKVEGGKKAKAKKETEEEEEEKVLEEKVVTLNLRHAYLAYSRKQTPRSIRLVKKAAGRIFKSDDIKIDERLNEILWTRGKLKAARRVDVKAQKLEGGTVRVLPATE